MNRAAESGKKSSEESRLDPSEMSISATNRWVPSELDPTSVSRYAHKWHGLPIVVIGTYNTNLVIWCDAIPLRGQSINGGEFEMYCGGQGANCAVAAARAGCQVKFIGAHGPDTFGRMGNDRLAAEGIDVSGFIELPSSKTGVAMFFQERKTAAHVAVSSISANNQFPASLVRNAERAIRESALVFTHFGISSRVLLEIYKMCDRHNKRLVLYAAAVQPRVHLPKRAYLMVARDFEARLLSGCDDLDSALLRLHRHGVQNVIIKQERHSLLFSDGARSGTQPIPMASPIQDAGSAECLTAWAGIALATTGDLAYAAYVGAEAMAFSFSRRGALDSAPYSSELQIKAFGK